MKRKTVAVTPAAIRAAARRNTKASARLEGREVPSGFVRSPAVERYIAASRTSDPLGTASGQRPGASTNRNDPVGSGETADDLLSFVKSEIWPLLEDRSQITKAEREQMAGDSTTDLRRRSSRQPAASASPARPAEGNPAVSHWNYRVVQSFDQTEYFIAEVYYAGDGIQGWVDSSRDGLRWGDYEDLRGSVELIQAAFDKPVLRVVEGDRLVEVSAT